MKRCLLLLGTLAALLVPGTQAGAASAADEVSQSKIPAELCFAVTGSDVERLVCSE
jgi:hypothetical protein